MIGIMTEMVGIKLLKLQTFKPDPVSHCEATHVKKQITQIVGRKRAISEEKKKSPNDDKYRNPESWYQATVGWLWTIGYLSFTSQFLLTPLLVLSGLIDLHDVSLWW